MNETPMLFPIPPTEFWMQIRIAIQEVIHEKVSLQIFTQTNVYMLRKRMLFRNNIYNISKVFLHIFYPQQKQKILRINVDDIFQ
jgi:hypothetical protein